MGSLSPTHQKLLAEILFLRLFTLLENYISEVCAKVACGAGYLDGSTPVLLKQARSRNDAMAIFSRYLRPKQIWLRWSSPNGIKDAVKHVIDGNDHVIRHVDQYGAFIAEMRKIRNRIAHNNAKCRREYQQIVRTYYGAFLNSVTPGMLLLSRRSKPIRLVGYIAKSRIFAKDLVKG